MGRQKGILKLKGRVGSFSFFETADGLMAREKDGIAGERIKNDPAYARTRENGEEFGRAGKASKLLRTALRSLLVGTADARVTSRLTREMVRVVKSDPISIRGKRHAMNGNLKMLEGFEFNIDSPFDTTFFALYTSAADRETGTLQIQLPEFDAKKIVAAPDGTTHFKFTAACVEIDFTESKFQVSITPSEPIAIASGIVTVPALTMSATPNSTKPLMLILGIEFGQVVNGVHYPLNDGSHNALKIVHVDLPG